MTSYERKAIVVKPIGGRPVNGVKPATAYLDDDGALPNEEELARLRRCVEDICTALAGQPISVRIEIRDWNARDGHDLVDWRTALRRLEPRDGRPHKDERA
jgi:hypothetical protein